jgi:hypothetical protein
MVVIADVLLGVKICVVIVWAVIFRNMYKDVEILKAKAADAIKQIDGVYATMGYDTDRIERRMDNIERQLEK